MNLDSIHIFTDPGEAVVPARHRQVRLPPPLRVHRQELPVVPGRREAGLGEVRNQIPKT